MSSHAWLFFHSWLCLVRSGATAASAVLPHPFSFFKVILLCVGRRQGRIMGTKVPANLCLTSGSFCFLRGFLPKLVPWLRPFKELLVSHVDALVANHISLMRVGFKFRQTIPNVGV